jgi:hypothetical protein
MRKAIAAAIVFGVGFHTSPNAGLAYELSSWPGAFQFALDTCLAPSDLTEEAIVRILSENGFQISETVENLWEHEDDIAVEFGEYPDGPCRVVLQWEQTPASVIERLASTIQMDLTNFRIAVWDDLAQPPYVEVVHPDSTTSRVQAYEYEGGFSALGR